MFNANSATFQLCIHGDSNFSMRWDDDDDDDEVRVVLDKHAKLDFYSAISLKQQSDTLKDPGGSMS